MTDEKTEVAVSHGREHVKKIRSLVERFICDLCPEQIRRHPVQMRENTGVVRFYDGQVTIEPTMVEVGRFDGERQEPGWRVNVWRIDDELNHFVWRTVEALSPETAARSAVQYAWGHYVDIYFARDEQSCREVAKG